MLLKLRGPLASHTSCMVLQPVLVGAAVEFARVAGLGWALKPSGRPACSPAFTCPSLHCSACPACNCGAGAGSTSVGVASVVLICVLVFSVGFGSALLFLKLRASVVSAAQSAPIDIICSPSSSARRALSDEARAQVRVIRDGAR